MFEQSNDVPTQRPRPDSKLRNFKAIDIKSPASPTASLGLVDLERTLQGANRFKLKNNHNLGTITSSVVLVDPHQSGVLENLN